MSNVKELRKQIRNVVQDLVPALLQAEVGEALRKDLSRQIQARLDVMMEEIRNTLRAIEDQSKDIQSYVVRQSLIPFPLQTGDNNEPKSGS